MSNSKSQDTIYLEYLENFKHESDQNLIDRFNRQIRIGFVMGRQMTMMIALNDTLYERFNNSPVYADQKRISSWREKIILIDSNIYVLRKPGEYLPELKSRSATLHFLSNNTEHPDLNVIVSVIERCTAFYATDENIQMSVDATAIQQTEEVTLYKIELKRNNLITDSLFAEKVIQICDILYLHLALRLISITDRYSELILN